jgi:ADP-heptose:LPS heptosyltransferase
VGVSARWDPRDHFLLRLVGAKRRVGYPRLGSRYLLNQHLHRPAPESHRYEYWRQLASQLGLTLPPAEQLNGAPPRPGGKILIHTGAGQPIRVWPLARFQKLTARLRAAGYTVLVACDPDQRDAWLAAGESAVVSPASVNGLLALIESASAFIGNDSGPGHLAACCGVPTFTIFGPQLPGWFAPLHHHGESIAGKACPYKPCSDYCRFAEPVCLTRLTEEEVWYRLAPFLQRQAALFATAR